MTIIVTETSQMSLLKCKNAFQMPSNINSDIKNKIKKKIISDRPTLIFFGMWQ